MRQRTQQPNQMNASDSSASGSSLNRGNSSQSCGNIQPNLEVNQEFLAALPPNIQEEVLTYQRIEQQRQAAIAANPEDPVDTAAFFQNLQPNLRQAVSELETSCVLSIS